MEQEEILARLRALGGLSEAYAVTTFRGFRPDGDGSVRLLTVEIWDAGPGTDNPDGRYWVRVQDETGREAEGSTAPSVEAGLASVRWTDLD